MSKEQKQPKKEKTIKVKTLLKVIAITLFWSASIIVAMRFQDALTVRRIDADNQRAVTRIKVIQDLVKVLK